MPINVKIFTNLNKKLEKPETVPMFLNMNFINFLTTIFCTSNGKAGKNVHVCTSFFIVVFYNNNKIPTAAFTVDTNKMDKALQ